jgi:RNA polymerase sigma-70 factor, ECF subfamily
MIGTQTSNTALSASREALRLMTEMEFEVLYRSTGRPLLTYITRLCGDASTAEDLLQKTFVQMLRVPVPADDEDQLRAYLYRSATNAVTDHWRRTRREESLEAHHERAETRSASSDLGHDMKKVFSNLSPQERALLWLAHVEQMPHRDIAESVGVKEKSVKVLLFRARRKLASMVEQKGLFGGSR